MKVLENTILEIFQRGEDPLIQVAAEEAVDCKTTGDYNIHQPLSLTVPRVLSIEDISDQELSIISKR